MKTGRASLVVLVGSLLAAHASRADTHYVWTNSPAPTSPYISWTNAAHDIQSAVDAAATGDTVRVTDGVYSLTSGWITVTRAITLRSVNGAVTTVVDGNHATRGFYLAASNAVVDGFTITNGSADLGGAIFCNGGGTVRNCTISGNSAQINGGGVFCNYGGTIERCVIRNNVVPLGDGGGVFCNNGGTVLDCRISRNSVPSGDGGGVFCSYGGTVKNCVISHNTVLYYGGGVYCVGGGSVENCTIAVNSAGTYGGGAYCDPGATVLNTIVTMNVAAGHANVAANTGSTFMNCCTLPAVGTNCIVDSPQFVNAGADNYRLQTTSPCINRGTNQAWMAGGVDLDGAPRIVNNVVDIGAYENGAPGAADLHLLPGATLTWLPPGRPADPRGQTAACLVNGSVRNDGPADLLANAIRYEVYLSENPIRGSGDRKIAEGVTALLTVPAWQQVSVPSGSILASFPSDLSAGVYYAWVHIAFADAGLSDPADSNNWVSVGTLAVPPKAVLTFPVSFPGRTVWALCWDADAQKFVSDQTLLSPTQIVLYELKPDRWYWVVLDVETAEGNGDWAIAYSGWFMRSEAGPGRWVSNWATHPATSPFRVGTPLVWLLFERSDGHAVVPYWLDWYAEAWIWGTWTTAIYGGWVGFQVPRSYRWYAVFIADATAGVWY